MATDSGAVQAMGGVTERAQCRHMDEKYFVDTNGDMDEHLPGEEQNRHVRFPVRLAVRYGTGNPVNYSSFVLNMNQGGVFIETDKPLEVGSRIVMHFYIPPEVKLLGEFEGQVVWANAQNVNKAGGMGIKFISYTQESMKQLEALLEEKHHLIDYMVE